MTALEISNVGVSFGGVTALAGIDMVVEPGERKAIVGPNGAGKSTIFNVIGGQLRPDSGSVHLFGEDVTRKPPYELAHRGLTRTWQITNLFDPLTVFETVQLAVAATGRTRRVFWKTIGGISSVHSATEGFLREWELWDVRQRPVQDLAYGEQRLLEIVVSLAADPKVLLLDEPTAGLTPSEAERMTTIVAGLSDRVTLIIIEHDMSVAFALADTMTVFAQGRVLEDGPIEEVRRRKSVIDTYLGRHDVEG